MVETVDGSLYLNCRNYVGTKRRAYAWSRDHGDTFGEGGWDEKLREFDLPGQHLPPDR